MNRGRFCSTTARLGGAHGDVAAGLAGDLFTQYLLEEVRVGQLRCGGLLQQRFEPLAAFEQAQLAQVLAGSICAGELIAAEAALFVGAVSAFMRPPQLCSDALLVDRQVAYFDLARTALVAAMLRVGSWA